MFAAKKAINIYVITIRLTEREKKDREHKKQLLKIAKEHEKARELERVQRYKMPEDIKKGENGLPLEALCIGDFYNFIQ